jgi:mannose-1-phosphate guanylyltransferase
MQLDSEEIVLVTPSDHKILDLSAYQKAVEKAKCLAEKGLLVTFGIQPNYPETGFGYIHYEEGNFKSFIEKPDLKTAEGYIQDGNYFWNGGIFCFKAGSFLKEMEVHAPEIYQACLLAHQHKTYKDQICCIPLEQMQAIPSDSIDYAVLEKSSHVEMVPCDMGWSDLGSFDSLYNEMHPKASQKPSQENVVVSPQSVFPELISIDSRDNLLVQSDRQIALVDVADLLIVDSADALLICKKGSSQKVKKVVEKILVQNPELVNVTRKVHRPWGTYEVLVDSKQYKVKCIVVKPGAKLSMQKHYHRNEHWVVVSGTASVTVEDKTFLVRPNESTYIQMGQIHRLANKGKIDLVIVEVQVGEYTGEDDIVRLDDIYIR